MRERVDPAYVVRVRETLSETVDEIIPIFSGEC